MNAKNDEFVYNYSSSDREVNIRSEGSASYTQHHRRVDKESVLIHKSPNTDKDKKGKIAVKMKEKPTVTCREKQGGAHTKQTQKLNASLLCSPEPQLPVESTISPSTNSAPLSKSLVVCNCKKSRCLKLYCDCFRIQRYCNGSCNCNDCANLFETENGNYE